MSAPKTPSVNRKKQEQREREERAKAEQRQRQEIRGRRGVAANILAGDTQGSRLGGASTLTPVPRGSATNALFGV